MRYYFVDYENVDVGGFEGMSGLLETDTVYIYYSENHNRMTFGLHRRITESKATFLYRKIKGEEKNALDDELMREVDLIAEQGLAIGQLPYNEYYIIANDTDYDAKVEEWRSKGARVERCASFKETTLTEEEKLAREKIKLQTEINQLKKEKEILLREKRMLQKETEARKAMKKAAESIVEDRLRTAGMTKKELEVIRPYLHELIGAKDRGSRSGTLTKLLPGRMLKQYLDAFEK